MMAAPTIPVTISTNMLINADYLPDSVSTTNTFGQMYVTLVIEPTPNKLQALVLTQGGEAMPELRLRRLASEVGVKGGYVSAIKPGVVSGVQGAWEVSLASYGFASPPGYPAAGLFFNEGTLVSDYLYRSSVPGRPELNRMNTDLDMAGNNIEDVNNAQAVNVRASGVFESTGDEGWYNSTHGGGWFMRDPDWIRAYGDKGIKTGGEIEGGSVSSVGRLSAGEYLKVEGTAAPGAACSENGLVSTAADGSLLSCVAGTWSAGSGGMDIVTLRTPGFLSKTRTLTCPEGYKRLSCFTMARADRGARAGQAPLDDNACTFYNGNPNWSQAVGWIDCYR
jgi:hypothetical protein